MSQSYDTIAGGDSISSSLTKIKNRDDALQSLHSGSSAPSTTVAYMLWADTNTGLLKIRNAADDNWVTLGTLASSYLGLNSGKSGLGYLTATIGAPTTGHAVFTAILNVGSMLTITDSDSPTDESDEINIVEAGTYRVKMQLRHNGSINSGIMTVNLKKNGTTILMKQVADTIDRDVELYYLDEFSASDKITLDVAAGAYLTTANTTFVSIERVK